MSLQRVTRTCLYKGLLEHVSYRVGKNYGPAESLLSNGVIVTRSEGDKVAVLKTAAELRRANQFPVGISVYPNRTKKQSDAFRKKQTLAAAYTATEKLIKTNGIWKATDRDGYAEAIRYVEGKRAPADQALMAKLTGSEDASDGPTDTFRAGRSKLKRNLTSGPPQEVGLGRL
jgi:hypothetical protein